MAEEIVAREMKRGECVNRRRTGRSQILGAQQTPDSARTALRTGAPSPAQAQGLNPRPCLTSGASGLLFGQFPRRAREIISPGESPKTRLPAVLSTRYRRLPGHVPMATPPSARSNARADARPPVVPQHRPMAIQGACRRLPPAPLKSQSKIRRDKGRNRLSTNGSAVRKISRQSH